MRWFPVLYVLTVVATAICWSTGRPEEPCTVQPSHEYVELGSNINVTCQSSCRPGRSYWTINSKKQEVNLSTTTGSSYAVLFLKTFTHHTAVIQCHNSFTNWVLGGMTIYSYTKPGNVSCILQYSPNASAASQPDQFRCNWEHKINPKDNTSLEITYSVRIKGASSQVPKVVESCSKTSCTLPETPDHNENSSVVVRAKTSAWEIDSDPYEFNPYHIWQLRPPMIHVNSLYNHLLVQWNQTLRDQRIICQVKYGEAHGGENSKRVLTFPLKPGDVRVRVTTEEVESCTNYTVSARCALADAPWSTWSPQRTVLSELNESKFKFNLWRKVGEPNISRVRRVWVMWRAIPPTCKGRFEYHIQGIPTVGNIHGSVTRAVDVNEDAHRIKLMVLHDGNLRWTESIHVPAFGASLPQVSYLQTKACDGNILVSWEAPVRPVSGYMIHWTHNGSKYFWAESKATNITLYDLEDFTQYNITVTPLFNNETGLGMQALQICSRERAPEAVSIVDDIEPKDISAHVKWSIESQKQCSGVVVYYLVFYKTENDPELNVTVSATEREVLLQELKPGTMYRVHVIAVSLTGNSSSSYRHFKTHWVDHYLIVSITVSIIICVVIPVFLAACCIVQWKKYKRKKVPDPRFSSIALWASQNHQKIVPVLSNPSESLTTCDCVYPCEQEQDTATVYTTLLHTGSHWDITSSGPANDQTEQSTSDLSGSKAEYGSCIPLPYPIDVPAGEQDEGLPVEKTNLQLCPAKLPAAGTQVEKPGNPSVVPTTVLLSSEISLPNPYQSQCVEEPPVWSTTDTCKLLQAMTQQGKMGVYVTMNMFEQAGTGQVKIRMGTM